MKTKVIGVIPARYGSSRFPGKIIADIAGKPMIQRVYEQAAKSQLLHELYVAVDDQRVFDVVTGFGGKAVMTSSQHQSGTDRIAEVVQNIEADVVANIQGDQPLLDPLMIDEAVAPMLEDSTIPMSTIKIPVDASLVNEPGVVTVVTDKEGFALYFSRSPIPFPRDTRGVIYYEHVGLYVYRKDFLQKIAQTPPGHLEQIEMLEQLRVLESGYRILVVETKSPAAAGMSVDTPEDLKKVEDLILKMK